jgi:hypothetical protein
MEPRYEVDDDGVRRFGDEGELMEAVRWNELQQVGVMTTADGPFDEDVFFVLEGGEHGCVVPQGFAPEDLLPRLQALPGFDNEQFIAAMSSTEQAMFACWARSAAA